MFYGFGACTLSTISAAILEHLLGSAPPYPLLSVPVVSGVAGGLAMIAGCSGLMAAKRRSAAAPTDGPMAQRDFGMLVALNGLAITGMLTLLARTSAAFSLILIVHLATIVVCFAIAPYTKFVHFVYRFLAIVKDNLDTARGEAVVATRSGRR